MGNTKFIGKRIAKIAVNIILIFLVIFANIFSVKAITIYAVEIMAYEKLSVAYEVGGMNALKLELASMLSESKFKRELHAAEFFRDNLDSLKDPGSYLKRVISEKRDKAFLLNKLRGLAIALIIALLLLRIALNIVLKNASA